MARYIRTAESFGDKNPIIATHAASDVSDRYQFASTADVLATLETAGWRAASTTAANVRKVEKLGFQKHMVRLDHPDFAFVPGLAKVNDTKPQIILVNAHDRGSSLKLLWGMYRLACLNGMVVSTGDETMVKLRHNASLLEKLPAALERLLTSLPAMIEQVQALQSKTLTAAAVEKLVKTVYDARLASTKDVVRIDYTMPRLRRHADTGADAYTVFNRVQEVALRGGIRYLTESSEVRRIGIGDKSELITHTTRRNGTTRAVSAIAETVRLNQIAYATALEVAA